MNVRALPDYSLRYTYDLFRELIKRDLKQQYVGTFLGYSWTLLVPFMQLGIFYFIFKVILEVDIPRFTTFTFIGIISFLWFQSSLTSSAICITSNRNIVLRPYFPSIVLPFVSVSSSMLHFIFAIPLILTIVLFESHKVPYTILIIPVVMVVQFLLCLGLGYFISVLNIIFRDTKHIVDILLRFLFFLSPIFYDPGKVPEKFLWLYNINPLVTILQSYRNLILEGSMPPWSSLGIVTMFSIVIVVLGMKVFSKQSHQFLGNL
jgi:lipopolysaccharide transport system permease protein